MKPKLFEPNTKLQVSVFFIDGMNFEEIKETGLCVAKQREKRLYGWGLFDDTAVGETGLGLVPDGYVCHRPHANIVGWPHEREERKHLQQVLASESRPVRLACPVSPN